MDDGLENNPHVPRKALAAHHAAAYAWALSLTGYDAAEAADVLQQSYLVIVEGRARYAQRSSLKTWLFGVVRNTALRLHRRNRQHVVLVSRFSADQAQGTAQNGESFAEGGDQAVVAALRSLPRRQRDVLELVVYSEFTLEECAQVLGISLGSARTHYHRAKASIRAKLEQDDA
jgi:RNA polymerase sigma factor (sigma-70 family)